MNGYGQQDQQQGNFLQEARKNVNFAVGIAQIISGPIEVWLRKPGTPGERYYGVHCLLGWLFIPFFGALAFSLEPLEALTWFFWMTAVMLLANRIRHRERRRKGYLPHSQYSGTPWIPGDQVKVKTFWEPALVMAVGLGLAAVNKPLGCYLLLAGFCLAVATFWQASADNARVRLMRDARLEQEYFMERVRQE